MDDLSESVRVPEATLGQFARAVFEQLGVPADTARLAVRSLLDASLLGVDTHGIEALDMYVDHLRAGGLDPSPKPVLVKESGALGLWDMRQGFGLAGARIIMDHAIQRAPRHGMALATCRNTNHIGACGVYGKMAADKGMIGIVSQQTRATFAPCGGKQQRVGTSPLAIAAPAAGGPAFFYDASFAAITGAKMKAHIRAGQPLPEGVAADADGAPTTDPQKAWAGQVMPIGGHKGVGLAMACEIFSAVLSGNVSSDQIPSIVSNPEQTAGSSVFMLVIDPEGITSRDGFAERMREYVAYVESSPARDPEDPPRYPGRRAGECWLDREKKGIPVRRDGLERINAIGQSLGIGRIG